MFFPSPKFNVLLHLLQSAWASGAMVGSQRHPLNMYCCHLDSAVSLRYRENVVKVVIDMQ